MNIPRVVLVPGVVVLLIVILAIPHLIRSRASEIARLEEALRSVRREESDLSRKVAGLTGQVRKLSEGTEEGARRLPPAPVVPTKDPDQPPAPGPAPLASAAPDYTSRLQSVAKDPTRSTSDRLDALNELFSAELGRSRPGGGLNGRFRPAEVVNAMLDLLEREPNAEFRKEICFHLLGAVKEDQHFALVRVLQSDPAPEVRSQAADTLQHLSNVPEVRTALEFAGASDPSDEVRDTAREMIRRADEKADAGR